MSRLGEAIRRAAWAHGTTLRDADVAERVAAEVAAELGPTDEQIRALVRSVVQATVEKIADDLRERGHMAVELGVGSPADVSDMLMLAREAITDDIEAATFGSAEDDPTHELHAVRGSG